MTLGIMQPYFFPYLGYWQLLNAVDKYVIYDDVNYIKGGWINRNRILTHGNAQYFNLLLQGASPNKLINELTWKNDRMAKRKMLNSIQMSYAKAPHYKEVFPLLREIIEYDSENIVCFLKNQIEEISNYLRIKTELIVSSALEKNNQLHGELKVLEICKILGAKTYINAEGGRKLYSRATFSEAGIQLKFLRCKEITYPQFKNDFVPNLSIIDVLMFNSRDSVQAMLKEYELF